MRPSETLYLRQFVGSSYEDGVWAPSDDGPFVEAEAQALGMSEEDVAQQLASTPYESALALFGDAGAARVTTLSSLADGLRASSLEPYASLPAGGTAQGSDVEGDAASNGAPAADAGDLLVGESGSADTTARYVTIPFGTYADLLTSGSLDGQAIGGDAYPQTATILADYAAWLPSTNLGVDPTALPRLSQLVAGNPSEGLVDVTDTILQLLTDNATYTIAPGVFPDDVEIPEYLLFDGHQGYCQHFATAAALMYRLYGIPSRYVTGYVIPANAFEQQADGTWRAVANDVRAHAWVEVYVDPLGWVPVEVTPPGSTQAAPYASDPAAGAAVSDQGSNTFSSEPGEAGNASETTGTGTRTSAEEGVNATANAPASTGAERERSEDTGASSPGTMASAASDGGGPLVSNNTSQDLADRDAGATTGAGESADGVDGTITGAASPGANENGDDPQSATASPGVASGQSAGPDADTPSSGSDTEEPGRSTWVLALAGVAGVVALAGLATLATHAFKRRRQHILAQRMQAPADALLADLLDALRYAGILRGVDGTEPDAASRIAQAVPTVDSGGVEHLVAEAQRHAFGPPENASIPSDERCHAAYSAACDFAYGTLPRLRRLAFTYLHAWR